MSTIKRPQTEPTDGFRDYHRAARQLRLAASGRATSEERRRWIRAATRC